MPRAVPATRRLARLFATLAGLLGASPVFAAEPRMAIGSDFVVVSRTDGSVWAWGRGNDGELGNGGRTSSSTPLRVSGLSAVVDLVAADGLSAALRADGTVWVWGSGAFGVFGSGAGDVIRSVTPVQIPELQGIVALAAGQGGPSLFAVDTAGRVLHWGTNRSGQFGGGVAGGGAEVRLVPQGIGGLNAITTVAAADTTFFAASRTGALFGWGSNPLGGLGVDTLTSAGGPPLGITSIPGAGDVTALALMDINDNAHFALRRDGTVAAWGTNSAAQAGCGQSGATTITAPRELLGVSSVTGLAAGTSHVLFVRSNGEVLACGRGSDGQLGDGTTTGISNTAKVGPVRVSLAPTVLTVAAGRNSSGAIGRDGSTWVWGSLANGAAGDGGATSGNASLRQQTTPLAVVGVGGIGSFDAGSLASAPALFAGTQTGTLASANVSVGLAPAPADVGRNGRIYVVALLPDGSFYANASGGGWVPWNGGPIPVFASGRLARHVPIALFTGADLRFAAGISLYTGYGVGDTDAAAQADLLNNVKYGVAVTLR